MKRKLKVSNMEIKTKYNIGDHVWVLYENRGEICVYDDYINEIVIGGEKIFYSTREALEEFKEEDVMLYEDEEILVKRIKELLENC